MKQFIFIFLVLCQIVFAGTTGKIVGRIVDAKTGEPLPAVNVVLLNTSMGASTDIDGIYYIVNVPVGTYSVRASLVGFGTKVMTQVKVIIDMSTPVDFSLQQEEIMGQEVIVVAERRGIQQDRTSTKHTIDEDAIASLPVDDFREIVQLQAGVVGSHFRGGRFNESLFLVDGLPIRSTVNGYTGYTGGFSLNVPQLGVSEIEVSTGGFEAEYGNAQSGVVNTLTKTGGAKFSGKLRVRTSDFPWSKIAYKSNDYADGMPDWKDYEFALSTPEGNLGFGKISLSGSGDISMQNRDVLPHSNFYRESFQGKINFNSASTRLTLSGLQSYSRSNSYYHTSSKFGPLSEGYQTDLFQAYVTRSGQKWLDQYHYVINPQNYPNTVDDTTAYSYFSGDSSHFVRNYYLAGMQEHISLPINQSYNIGLAWTQTLSKNSYLDVKLSYFSTHYREVVRDVDDRNKNSVTDEDLSLQLPDQIGGYFSRVSTEGYWYYYGDEGWWLDQTAATTSFKADYSNQINQHNLIKSGAEFNYHQGNVDKVTFESASRQRSDIWEEDLYDLAFYVQDKIEVRDGFIINAGLRFDYYDPNGLTNPVLYPGDMGTVANYPFGVGLTNADKVPAHWQISPRIGISHPITERDKIHFYYGHFFQRPDFRYLYENMRLDFTFTTNVDVGNPRLLPEKTVSYEIGWEHLFSDNLRMGITGYFKDITNLVGASDFSNGTDMYQAYVNMDYANVRGIEVNLESFNTKSASFMFNYTYAFANGRSSSVFRSNGEIVPRRLDPLDWDERHKFNLNLSIRSTGWADRYVGDAEIVFIVTAHSGLPYTSNTKGGFPLFTLRNDGRLPWTKNVDVRVRKTFAIAMLDVSLLAEVKNLFDTRNVSFIAGGNDGIKEFEATGDPRGPYKNPTAYTAPRVYRLGVEIHF